MNQIILYLIMVLHFFVVLFIVVVPFVGNVNLLFWHSVICPFIMAHWYLNDDACCLTQMEKGLRLKIYGTPPNEDDCFTCRFINPIYNFRANNMSYSAVLYGVTSILWLISVFKLGRMWKDGRITSFSQLLEFRI